MSYPGVSCINCSLCHVDNVTVKLKMLIISGIRVVGHNIDSAPSVHVILWSDRSQQQQQTLAHCWFDVGQG